MEQKSLAVFKRYRIENVDAADFRTTRAFETTEIYSQPINQRIENVDRNDLKNHLSKNNGEDKGSNNRRLRFESAKKDSSLERCPAILCESGEFLPNQRNENSNPETPKTKLENSSKDKREPSNETVPKLSPETELNAALINFLQAKCRRGFEGGRGSIEERLVPCVQRLHEILLEDKASLAEHPDYQAWVGYCKRLQTDIKAFFPPAVHSTLVEVSQYTEKNVESIKLDIVKDCLRVAQENLATREFTAEEFLQTMDEFNRLGFNSLGASVEPSIKYTKERPLFALRRSIRDIDQTFFDGVDPVTLDQDFGVFKRKHEHLIEELVWTLYSSLKQQVLKDIRNGLWFQARKLLTVLSAYFLIDKIKRQVPNLPVTWEIIKLYINSRHRLWPNIYHLVNKNEKKGTSLGSIDGYWLIRPTFLREEPEQPPRGWATYENQISYWVFLWWVTQAEEALFGYGTMADAKGLFIRAMGAIFLLPEEELEEIIVSPAGPFNYLSYEWDDLRYLAKLIELWGTGKPYGNSDTDAWYDNMTDISHCEGGQRTYDRMYPPDRKPLLEFLRVRMDSSTYPGPPEGVSWADLESNNSTVYRNLQKTPSLSMTNPIIRTEIIAGEDRAWEWCLKVLQMTRPLQRDTWSRSKISALVAVLRKEGLECIEMTVTIV
ncbi:hypothetical protein H072_5230 [Dactylellina haptotyla CBS 200.50]|uniref:Uncharacterized protein n=1 Tax=Dactylellina haptotyla (strain CBS 200.50) TaxID=1284197 RepID=S8AD88_DACHA|nr:hypothetical protein H072_5230 [Dactylellina haptotyla CBS 200.50]